MFRILDILLPSRNLGSVHLITDPDLAVFVRDLQDAKKKYLPYVLNFFAYKSLYVHLHQSLKINNALRSHLTAETKAFLNFCACS